MSPATTSPRPFELLRSLFRIAIGSLLGLVLLIYPYLWLSQERLIFLRTAENPQLLEWARARLGGHEIWIEADEGVRLHGWLLPVAGDPEAPLVIYFGGNAEDVTGMLTVRDELPGRALLLVNYRGYGESGGEPGEQTLFADALRIHDWALAQPSIQPERVYAWGRSLGTGVAVHLAAHRPLAGVLLISPFDSLRAVAEHHYPYVPVRWLLRHPFDSAADAPALQIPLLAIAARDDGVIPFARSQALVDAWGGPKQLLAVGGADHNDLDFVDGYWEAIRAFLGRQDPGSE